MFKSCSWPEQALSNAPPSYQFTATMQLSIKARPFKLPLLPKPALAAEVRPPCVLVLWPCPTNSATC